MAEKYTVTIERIREVEKTAGKDWQLIGTAEKSEYGYTPEILKTVLERDTIYTQVVDSLNLRAVIDAVNDAG